METHRRLFFVLSLLAVVSAASAAVRRGTVLGGYSPIKDLKDPHVVEIAEFAISEHNKETGSKLQYLKIVKGESQVVSGTNYRLEISAKDGGSVHNYEAVVYDKPWEHLRSLTSFKLV